MACLQLRNSFDEAFGGFPGGVVVRPVVVRAAAGHGLVGLADRSDDLLVVGAGERDWPARWFHGRTSRYCLGHAGCRVLAVPPPALMSELSLWQRHRLPQVSFEEVEAGSRRKAIRPTGPSVPRHGEGR
jgi:hypothetical protein